MKKYGFVYKWFNKKTNMCYIGRHQGVPNADDYIGSSTDFLDAYKLNPKDWKRTILCMGDYEDIKKEEPKEIRKAVKEYGIQNIFNKCYHTKTSDDIFEMSQSKLYSEKKKVEQQILDLQNNILELEEYKLKITNSLKRFSSKMPSNKK